MVVVGHEYIDNGTIFNGCDLMQIIDRIYFGNFSFILNGIIRQFYFNFRLINIMVIHYHFLERYFKLLSRVFLIQQLILFNSGWSAKYFEHCMHSRVIVQRDILVFRDEKYSNVERRVFRLINTWKRNLLRWKIELGKLLYLKRFFI